METTRRKIKAVKHGALSMSPILMGIIPFGLVFGVSSVTMGFSVFQASMMSLCVFAGASQLAAVQLMGEHAPLLVVAATGLVINLRMLMYSASIAPHFAGLSIAHKGFLAYFLTDQAYAMSLARYAEGYEKQDKGWYYLGGAATIWAGFNVCTILGALLGASLPVSWDLEFAIPLTFLALLIPLVKGKPDLKAAISAAGAALLLHDLPYNGGLLIAAVIGVVVGYFAAAPKEQTKSKLKEAQA